MRSGLYRDERALVVEVTVLALWPLVQSGGVDYDLARRIKLDVRAVHRSRRRSLEVYAFAGVTASVARAFELVLARFPIGCAAQVSASGVNHEKPFGVSNNPDAVLLLKFCIDSKTEVGRIADSEDGAWFEDGSWEEEAQKHHEAGGQEAANGRPDDRTAHLVDWIGCRALDSLTLRSCGTAYSRLSRGLWFLWRC